MAQPPILRRREEAVEVRLRGFTLTASVPGASEEEIRAVAMQHREQLDAFRASGRALEDAGEKAPRVVRLAAEAAEILSAGMGPDAVGALVQSVGEDLAGRYREAAVAANGVSFVSAPRPREMRLDGGGRIFSFEVSPGRPAAAFSSGARSDPLPGRADAVVFVAGNGALAEAGAIEAVRDVRKVGDVAAALERLRAIPGARAAAVVGGPAVAVFGAIRIDAA